MLRNIFLIYLANLEVKRMDNPYCLIISGPSGSGKSTIAKRLWSTLDGNPAHLNLDSIKHLLHGAESNDYFLDLARINALSLTENYLRKGHPVIVDKAFGYYGYVEPFIDLAKRIGVPSYYFRLIAPLNVLIERVENRRNSSLREKIEFGEWPLPSGNEETATRIYKFFEKHHHSEGIEIDSARNSVEEIVERIKEEFK